MDFCKVQMRTTSRMTAEVYPEFLAIKSEDLLIKGRDFYAIWDEEAGRWSKDEHDAFRLIDREISEYVRTLEDPTRGYTIRWAHDFTSGVIDYWKRYLRSMPDSDVVLDMDLTFAHDVCTKESYSSKRLPYDLVSAPIPAYEELMSTLYLPDEREKIEWAIGAIVAGDAKKIQKFLVLYGEAGTGKSTVLNIIEQLFEGYYCTFDAKALGSSSNAFATEAFKGNALVGINHDGDLSRIEDNTRFNSIVSHEAILINEKYKSAYPAKVNAFLFIGTNQPVRITDSKSGLLRRLIDVSPSGNLVSFERYNQLKNQIRFELGGIAQHCKELYLSLGKDYYDSYRPMEMMYETDHFFNFVEDSYLVFKKQGWVSMKQAWSMYKEYCDNANVPLRLPMYKFRSELKAYFNGFEDRYYDAESKTYVRSVYTGFKASKFDYSYGNTEEKKEPFWLDLDSTESLFDKEMADAPAQYATSNETPMQKWDECKTTLKEIDTKELHYVKLPENHIVIDFDLKEPDGNKSLPRNLEAAKSWPPTYAEVSKGGAGLHLHYIYAGPDPKSLSRVYSPGIEVKVFTGNSSLRRRLSICNTLPIAAISSGLPVKEAKTTVNQSTVNDEMHLRNLIKKALNKEIHANTRPNVDFINKLLEDTYASGMPYDVTDLRPKVLYFALGSTNQSKYCLGVVTRMKFKSAEVGPQVGDAAYGDKPIVFYDVEVFPNLFLVNWKFDGAATCTRMINPSPQEIGELFEYKLIGFNCRRYDNHIMYARYLGYTNEQLYVLSQRIIKNSANCYFSEAYNLSYTDVYDFCATKQSLKKWEIELGLHHQELGLPWDQPVPEDQWVKVAEYCDNDVISTEAVFHANQGDWTARKILADLSGLTVNDTTNSHTKAIIFGSTRNPQPQFNYWDLSQPVPELDPEVERYLRDNTPLDLEFDGASKLPYFPGYTFDRGTSTYRDEVTGEGGYVYAEPGIYHNVALLDIASMHPSSLEDMCMFGPTFTKRFSEIKQARIYVKHKEFDKLSAIFDGKLAKYAEQQEDAEALSYALKIAINSVYGLTSAKFDNACRDPRNVDNIVAKRGALFMIDLKHAVQERGFTVAHIKTDSIKIPNANQEIIQFVMDFGKRYGYIFEHESTYEKMCLVNDAVYIAKVGWGKHAGTWSPTGAQFAQPYVFKTLFSREPLTFADLCETKQVSSALYLDMNEALGEDEHCYQFVGRIGSFVPIAPGYGGGVLLRQNGEKYDAATGSKGYRWLEAETVQKAYDVTSPDGWYMVDLSYHNALVDAALEAIRQYGDAEAFIADDPEPEYPFCTKQDCGSCPDYTACHSMPAAMTA